MFKDELKAFVNSNPKLVSMKPAGEGMFVLKYTRRVFYDNLWNNYIAECRGTIVDGDFNVIQRPFTKIYNYGIEKEAPVLIDDTLVTALRKVNGFMVAMTWHNDDILVSTTGSTANDYVDMAKEYITDNCRDVLRSMPDFTLMFECVHPNDPHIIPEDAGLYFIGFRHKAWDGKLYYEKHTLDPLGEHLGCRPVEIFKTTLGELKALVKTVRHEGFVFYTEDGVSSKIKSPYYLTSKWVARNPRTDKLVDLNKDIKHNIDEEYYGLIDAIRLNIEAYTAMTEQERLSWVRNFMEAV